jgi:hypothetical protein
VGTVEEEQVLAQSSRPREVSNRIKGFFVSRKHGPEEIRSFREFLEASKDELSFSSVISILDGSVRLGIPWESIISWDLASSALSKNSAPVSSTLITKGFVAIGSLRLDDSRIRQYLKLLWAAASGGGSIIFTPLEAANCLYNLHAIRIFPSGDYARFLDAFALSLDRSTSQLPSKTICNAIYGMRRLSASSPEVRRIISALARRIMSSASYFHSVNVCIALNGLQNMDDMSSEVRMLLNALIEKSVSADEQGADPCVDREISMALFGLQKMGEY